MQTTFSFLKALDQNNTREWFQANKGMYETSHQEMLAFTDRVVAEMNTVANHNLISGGAG